MPERGPGLPGVRIAGGVSCDRPVAAIPLGDSRRYHIALSRLAHVGGSAAPGQAEFDNAISTRYSTVVSQTKFAVLGLLTLGPMSGYDLKKKSERSLAHFWHESYGNLYPRLAELQADGLVTARKERRESAPDAIVYRITPRGRKELAAWLREPAAVERFRSELLLKVFFGAQVPVQVTLDQLSAYRAQQEAVRATYAAIEARLREELNQFADAPFRLMTLRRGQLLTEARLRWCDETLEALAHMRAAESAAESA